jgi:hypothetical protein
MIDIHSSIVIKANEIKFVTPDSITCDILKRLNDFDFVMEISGDYTGTPTGVGASHERRGRR